MQLYTGRDSSSASRQSEIFESVRGENGVTKPVTLFCLMRNLKPNSMCIISPREAWDQQRVGTNPTDEVYVIKALKYRD